MKRFVTIICLLALVFASGGLSRLAKVEAAPKAEVASLMAADIKAVTEAAKEHCCDKQKHMETSCSGPLGLLVSSIEAAPEGIAYRPKPASSRLCVDLTNSGMKRPPRLNV